MPLVFDIGTSVLFWRLRYPLDRMPQRQACELPTACLTTKKSVTAAKPGWIDAEFLKPAGGVLHVLDINGGHGRRYDSLAVHAWQGPIPPGSFYELKQKVYVESPSFMFLQAGALLNLSQLIAFGDELCGLYSFDAREARGFRKRRCPLITKSELERFIGDARGCRGVGACLKALPFIVERSASPMETFDEMLFCLPYRYGGYGISAPLMNYKVYLDARAARVSKRGKCYLDMGYPQYSLDIEHHGKLDHARPEEAARDVARVNGLREQGFEVIELTAAQVDDLLAFEVIAQRVATITGKRIRSNALGAQPARLALRQSLRSWNASSGLIRQA